MTSKFFQNLLKYGYVFIEKLAKPHAVYYKDRIAYEVAYTRNKFLFGFEVLLLLLVFGDVSFNNYPFESIVIRTTVCLTMALVFSVSCRSHPHIFNLLCNLIGLAYGPSRMLAPAEGIYKAWNSTTVIPTIVYVFTGNFHHFLFQMVIQTIYMNVYYKEMMVTTISSIGPEMFIKGLADGVNLSIIMHLIFATLTNYFMKSAYQQIAVVEKKKDEIENQKTFLLSFSHELRNLINSLTGNVKLQSLEHLTPRAKELLVNAEVCGELLLHLVNNILDTGKVEIGELEINPVPTRVYDTFERIWGVCSELIKKKNLTGKMNIPKNLPTILKIDHYRITQIFLNLVGNAVKFTDQGSITITIDWTDSERATVDDFFYPYPFNYFDDHDEGLFEKQKTLSSLDKNNLTLDLKSRKVNSKLLKQSSNSSRGILKVSISDTGNGMSEDELGKLFHKFTQVTTDSSKRKLGTGLGLFITRQLCQRMQGEVKAFSKKGLGSTFIFCIPAEIMEDKNGSLQDLESTRQFLGSKNITAMIVDDTSFNQTILKCFLEKLGIEVMDIANNGLEAWEKYLRHANRGNPPQIVTMDLDMPILDGKEAAKKIRQYEVEKNLHPCFLPIISGNCSESEIVECLDKYGQVKADIFLKKPATLEEILRATANHFSH